jgi:WD40 repeat protein
VAFAPDGKRALSCSSDQSVRLWDLNTGKQTRSYDRHRAGVYSVAFSPDGKLGLSASGDHTVRLWGLPK